MAVPLLKDALGWGFVLWLIGYALGIMFFVMLPPGLIGWAIMPIGVALTIWVLVNKVQRSTLDYYLAVGAAWTAIAIVFDYFFIVQAFAPADGYYKLDVYLYYGLTFTLPLAVGWRSAKAGGGRFDRLLRAREH